MKRLYALVIALLMLCAGCNVKTTPEPQTIPPIETPMQQGGSATTAPDENVPTTQAEPSAPAEGDISPEIPDDLREALESGYAEAKAINADVAGFYDEIRPICIGGWKDLRQSVGKSEKQEYYAKYWIDGRWVKYGSTQILGGELQ